MIPTPASLEGQPVPTVTFKARPDDQWRDITTDELFKGRTVVVFSLPGAFTPTCSSTHLPGYNELAPVFKEHGVDEIVCISVNDAFVMNEWKAGQEADNITVIPDGNGDFTEGMGMLVDKRDLGFGKRSWRYSMLVKDGIVDKAFIAPDARKPEPVVIFSKPGCPHCARAKALLQDHQIVYTDISQDQKINTRVLRAVSGAMTWPQVFMGGKLIGNADALEAYFKAQA